MIVHRLPKDSVVVYEVVSVANDQVIDTFVLGFADPWQDHVAEALEARELETRDVKLFATLPDRMRSQLDVATGDFLGGETVRGSYRYSIEPVDGRYRVTFRHCDIEMASIPPTPIGEYGAITDCDQAISDHAVTWAYIAHIQDGLWDHVYPMDVGAVGWLPRSRKRRVTCWLKRENALNSKLSLPQPARFRRQSWQHVTIHRSLRHSLRAAVRTVATKTSN